MALSEECPLRVLVAENHSDVSECVARLIDCEPDMRCVGQVASANEVLSAVRSCDATALVLDLGLEDGSGLDLIAELARAAPALRIVVFSGHANDVLARESMQRGAAAFVIKGSDPTLLINELRGERTA